MNKSGQKFIGQVSSNKMQNTVVVRVEAVKVHPKYQKRYKVFKKFVADTAGVEYAIGDRVEILESKPISKTKRWTVLRKV